MIRWLDDLSGWTGHLPAALILFGASPAERRDALHRLAALSLGADPAAVIVEHRPQRRPKVVAPAGAGLHVSSSTRGETVVVAAARSPMGVDVEVVAPSGDVPFLVLHPDEARFLRALPSGKQACAFTRLWTLKEAYLKALGVGFERAPDSFRVRFTSASSAAIEDPAARLAVLAADTCWRVVGDAAVAVSAVVLKETQACGAVP